MFEELRSAVATIESFLARFEPGVLSAHQAVLGVELFAQVHHLGSAGMALATQRVDETGAFRQSGARSAGHWLAGKAGVGIATAFNALETVESLSDLPATNAAFRAGQLSDVQAHAIVGAADDAERTRRQRKLMTRRGRSGCTTVASCVPGSIPTARHVGCGAWRPTRAPRSTPRWMPRST